MQPKISSSRLRYEKSGQYTVGPKVGEAGYDAKTAYGNMRDFEKRVADLPFQLWALIASGATKSSKRLKPSLSIEVGTGFDRMVRINENYDSEVICNKVLEILFDRAGWKAGLSEKDKIRIEKGGSRKNYSHYVHVDFKKYKSDFSGKDGIQQKLLGFGAESSLSDNVEGFLLSCRSWAWVNQHLFSSYGREENSNNNESFYNKDVKQRCSILERYIEQTAILDIEKFFQKCMSPDVLERHRKVSPKHSANVSSLYSIQQNIKYFQNSFLSRFVLDASGSEKFWASSMKSSTIDFYGKIPYEKRRSLENEFRYCYNKNKSYKLSIILEKYCNVSFMKNKFKVSVDDECIDKDAGSLKINNPFLTSVTQYFCKDQVSKMEKLHNEAMRYNISKWKIFVKEAELDKSDWQDLQGYRYKYEKRDYTQYDTGYYFNSALAMANGSPSSWEEQQQKVRYKLASIIADVSFDEWKMMFPKKDQVAWHERARLEASLPLATWINLQKAQEKEVTEWTAPERAAMREMERHEVSLGEEKFLFFQAAHGTCNPKYDKIQKSIYFGIIEHFLGKSIDEWWQFKQIQQKDREWMKT